MKIIYLVRHGETTSNVDEVVQGLDDPLTERGKLQADRVAKRATGIEFDRLISSDAVRTHDTAKAIAKTTGKEIELMEMFREVRRPNSMVGLSRNTEEYQSFLQAELDHMSDKDWRVEDGENFFDVVERVKKVVDFFDNDIEGSALVVTHGHFLRHLVSYLLTKGDLTPELWLRMGHVLLTDNTALTAFKKRGDRWCLLTFNDYSHFAD